MAKRNKRMKIQPSELNLTFPIGVLDSGAGYSQKTIDLSQCASIVNRRAYRQGLNWAVSGFTLHTITGDAQGNLELLRLPSTWTVSGSWEKTMRMWLKQQNEAIDEAGMESAVARYRDFKIHMDKTHVDSGFGANFIPNVRSNDGLSWTPYETGEWDHSQVVLPNSGAAPGTPGNTQEYALHMIGDDDAAPAQSKGMIKAYAESRATPFSPDPVTIPGAEDNLFVQMFDVGMDTTDVIDNAIDRNDGLPYDRDEYPGSQLNADGLVFHDVLSITGTTVSGKTRCPGATFPCGLIRLKIDNGLGAIVPAPGEVRPVAWLQVHLVPGTHRGYMAENMVDM